MAEVWRTLVPLVVASALVPLQLVVTILLLRAPSGTRVAVAWTAGMTAVRLVQGVVFGFVLGNDDSGTATGTSPIASTLLLVVAVLLLVTAARQWLAGDDADAAPPAWMEATAAMTASRAFLLGAGLMAIGAKFWVFTLGAISAIGDAGLGRARSIVTFLVFALLAASGHLVLIGITVLAPDRADVALGRASAWLTRNNRVIMIVIGLGFGTWFLLQALDGLGVI